MPDTDRTHLAQFVALVDLKSIECIESSARNTSQRRPGDKTPSFAVQPSFQLNIHTPDQGEPTGWFCIDVRVDIEFEEGGAHIAHRAFYEHTRQEPPSVRLLTEFTNEVAVMHLLPYLRETLAEATRRVFGQPLMMPMFQRGQLAFTTPERQDTPHT